MEIVRLEPKQKRQAAEVVSAAFFDYPMFTLYFPDRKKRSRLLPWYLGNVLSCALRYGEVHAALDSSTAKAGSGGFTGVMFTLPPGHTKLTIREYSRNGFLFTPIVLGIRTYLRTMECEAFVGDAHEKIMAGRPHHYLWGLVASPGQQRKGVGSSLLAPLLAKADAGKMPVYLETHEEKNVAYYQRAGFELVHTEELEKYGLRIWCMVREPRSAE